MKKLFLTLALVAFATATSAQELLLGSDGSVRVTTAPVEYVETGVTVLPEAAGYTTGIAQAYKNPGVLVTVTWSSTFEKRSIFGVTYITRGSQAVLFNQEENLISLVDSGEVKERNDWDWFLVMLLISAPLMLVSWLMNKSFAVTFAAVLAAVSAGVIFAAAAFSAVSAAAFAFAPAAAAAAAAALEDHFLNQISNWYYIIFYLLLSGSIAAYLVAVL